MALFGSGWLPSEEDIVRDEYNGDWNTYKDAQARLIQEQNEQSAPSAPASEKSMGLLAASGWYESLKRKRLINLLRLATGQDQEMSLESAKAHMMSEFPKYGTPTERELERVYEGLADRVDQALAKPAPMTPERLAKYQQIIASDFTGMKNMLDLIAERIAKYPVYTQLEFIKPLQHMITEAFQDACNPNDDFLNKYDGGDRVVVSPE